MPRRGHKEKRRSTADKVNAQGTGRAVSRAFGSRGGKRVRIKSKRDRIPKNIGLPAGAWDAFASAHAPLPRSVGPYTVVRTTRMITTNSKFAMIGAFQQETGGTKYWSNVVCAAANAGYTSAPINSASSTDFFVTTAPGGNSASPISSSFTCVPSAISVQIMGQASLQNASGQFAAAVVPARMDMYGDDRSWDDLSVEFIAYMRPRLLSGGKLVLRGVQMDSVPLSMADVSEFLPMYPVSDGLANGWGAGGVAYRPRGWSPLCLYNETEQPVTLLIAVEWRVRFDLSSPAVASHSHHGVSSDNAWDAHLRKISSSLPAVCDIAEKVANVGMALYRNPGRGAMVPFID